MNHKPVEKSQHDKFKEAARQLEADESEAAFDEKLKAITEQRHGGKEPKSTKGEKGE